MRRRKLVDVFEKSFVERIVLERQVIIDCGVVYFRLKARELQKTFYFGGKSGNFIAVFQIIKWFDAEEISSNKNFFLNGIVNTESKHATKFFENIWTKFYESRKNHFGIAVRFKSVIA